MVTETDRHDAGGDRANPEEQGEDPCAEAQASATQSGRLGRPGCPIRVLNFAGGGFDTIMQLGVAHALLVIQGRAPDAIVGVSAGAIQAVAVAEVMQAGEEFDAEKQADREKRPEVYQRRRAARVARFREMVKASQKAPEELIDASFPDAYQIESLSPLQPLRTARFVPEERDAREQQRIVRSGLVALYNDALGVHVPLGVVTRIVRRLLGVYAAGAIPDGRWCRGCVRFMVQVLEWFRIWLLIGVTLPRFLTLLPLLLRPFYTLPVDWLPVWLKRFFRRHAATAGSLIFRLPYLRTALIFISYGVGLFLLASFWVGVSALVSLPTYLWLSQADSGDDLAWLATFLLPLAVPLGLTLAGFSLKHDAQTPTVAWINSVKEIVQFSLALSLLGSPLFFAALLFVGADLKLLPMTPQHGLAAFFFPASGTLIVWALIATAYGRFVGDRRHQLGTNTFLARLVRASIVLALWCAVLHLIATGLKLLWTPELKTFDDLAKVPETHDNFSILIRTSVGLLGLPLLVIVGAALRGRLAGRSKRSAGDRSKAGPAFGQWYSRQLLKSYKLSSSLLHHYGLEKFLTELFDPSYYAAVDWRDVWEKSLKDPPLKELDPVRPCEVRHDPKAKRIRDYGSAQRRPAIALGLAVANVGENGVNVIDVMADCAPVVTGLRAATAWSPLFPPVCYDDDLYVDSTNVCPVPLPALVKLLHRHGVNPESTVVQVYRVASVPFSRGGLARPLQARPMLNLVDIVNRAVKLRQLRDADLERRLAERYTRFMPLGQVCKRLPGAGGVRYRMRVTPIELDLPVGLNARIMFANRDERRAEILTTIAQGCRAALEVMITDSIDHVWRNGAGERDVSCPVAVRRHLAHGIDEASAELFGRQPLPGSRATAAEDVTDTDASPPGLWEICEHCRLGTSAAGSGKQRLKWRNWKETARSWPHEFDDDRLRESNGADRHFEPHKRWKPGFEVIRALRKEQWPALRNDSFDRPMQPDNRPLVNLLFSGGVFRGVFQVGVINALDILGLKPDIVAGASVGSITGAMAAQLLHGDDSRDCKTVDERRKRLALLATVYLAVDRVILTDRFADFVREFTVRAAATRFSLRQADRLFRKYDQPWLVNFDKGARQVTGGIERLFYVSPYQLNQLVKAARHRRGGRFGRLTSQLAQQWLNRMNVSEEVLGADALSELITDFLGQTSGAGYYFNDVADDHVLRGAFAPFLKKGVMLLATVTDLTEGRLLTLGDPFRGETQAARLDLDSALLASSAFPGVFRPRWATEVFPDTDMNHQLIDGGVMDNLPVEAVLNVLWSASPAGKRSEEIEPLIGRRPLYEPADGGRERVPHLMFAASLEPDYDRLSGDPARLDPLKDHWPDLIKRTRQLGYNFKLDQFRMATQEIAALYDDTYASDGVPLDLEVCALKPRWLCKTYAFHPMLGFRRARQAESIAHGCAMTLLKFKSYDRDEHEQANGGKRPANRNWLYAWGVRVEELPTHATLEQAQTNWDARRPRARKGECWLRQNRLCPFSAEALAGLGLQQDTVIELARIHACCEKPQTHELH